MEEFTLIGACGLYCGSCSHYKVSQPEGEVSSTRKGLKTLLPNTVMGAVQKGRQNTVASAALGLARRARGYFTADSAQTIRVSG